MITMFLAATFGMMALLSVPISIPPFGRVFGPPAVEAPEGPQAGPATLPEPSWGRPEVTAATLAEQVVLLSDANPLAAHAPAEASTLPPVLQRRGPIVLFLGRLAHQITGSAGPRLKALIRTGKVEGRQVLMRTAVKLVHEHALGEEHERGNSVGRHHRLAPHRHHCGR
jgi:hypothetical protein